MHGFPRLYTLIYILENKIDNLLEQSKLLKNLNQLKLNSFI